MRHSNNPLCISTLLIRFLIDGRSYSRNNMDSRSIWPQIWRYHCNDTFGNHRKPPHSGSAVGENAVDFAKGIVLGNIPWFAYIFTVILLTQRIGLTKSLALGLLVWILLVLLHPGFPGLYKFLHSVTGLGESNPLRWTF